VIELGVLDGLRGPLNGALDALPPDLVLVLGVPGG